MNSISNKLKLYPSKHPHQIYSKNYPYPLRWTELLGEIFHPLCYKYQNNIIRKLKQKIKFLKKSKKINKNMKIKEINRKINKINNFIKNKSKL